ncbi:MAG TPA: PVC-type heme-binding CxxCH protein [Tepidisphaeraceae bacterium]|nr:PVC-type heme-binding CxxCH protein [Tepidisphaeraceae bacterium]
MRAMAAVLVLSLVGLVRAAEPAGVLPVGEDGKPLNLDFETGTLKDWTAAGDAFAKQPLKGDIVAKRRSDMKSGHRDEYWIGGFEVAGDQPKGTLTSAPFTVTHPFASFLVGGGPNAETRVELVQAWDNIVFYQRSGAEAEDMFPVVVDLKRYAGKQIYIRLVDEHTGHWGHLNFDDFKFYTEAPKAPAAPGKAAPPPVDVVKNAGLTAEQAVKEMTLPDGFSATVFAAEPDITQPIAMCMDARGRLWVVEAHSYPKRQPEGQGKDRIIIFEDTDGDGKHDKRTVFMEGLNLVSGIEVGFGGVFVGAAPQFLFIPDKDGDDKPDGPPVVLLDGWGLEDTHETLNAFMWGPDGWLYGCHGVFTFSKVGKPGTPAEQRIPINAGIWRYQPVKQVFEVFAEGTSNPWGVDFNDQGQAFCTACVIPHLFHIIQGARYTRQAGQHYNPYIYKDIKTIADHVHYAGTAGPHAGNNRSDAAGGGHAHCGAMIYLGDSWPAQYRNSILMGNVHGNRINNDLLDAHGSGYVGKHGADFLKMNDKWSRLINMKYGPDGSVFMIDWYDKQACHDKTPERWDRGNGRVYKLAYNGTKGKQVDLAKMSDGELAKLQLSSNDWYVRTARKILQERASEGAKSALLGMLAETSDPVKRLRVLWALHVCGGVDETVAMRELKNPDQYVRAWIIQLAAEDKKVSSEMMAEFVRMASDDPSPVVRLYLASAMQRLPLEQRWDVIRGLVKHAEDSEDGNLPLLTWYAMEPLAAADPARALKVAGETKWTEFRQFVARRIASSTQKKN